MKTAVINVVGLTPSLLGTDTPFLSEWIGNARRSTIRTSFPAVTCTVQADMLTGRPPREHGIVGNGWYFRDEAEVKFWRQSNRLVLAPKVWDVARQRMERFTCTNMFWWYNMYSNADVSVTPRPMYPADGRKLPDVHSRPAVLRDKLQHRFGQFPLFHFWGPKTSIRSTKWIVDATMYTDERYDSTLTLVYLPHLDYALQRWGPHSERMWKELREIDQQAARLIRYFEKVGAEVIVLSEYGITPVDRPIHVNRALREGGFLAIREELGREYLDPGASAAFAVADHQVAHVYVNDPARMNEVRACLRAIDGVERLLDEQGKSGFQLDHERAGDFVLLAAEGTWFTYYFWEDDRRAPDYARTVDIHRKPGYDPIELFVDPSLWFPMATVASKVFRKKLGFRTLLDVIPLDASLVRGSHGRVSTQAESSPLIATKRSDLLPSDTIRSTDVFDVILNSLGASTVSEVSEAA